MLLRGRFSVSIETVGRMGILCTDYQDSTPTVKQQNGRQQTSGFFSEAAVPIVSFLLYMGDSNWRREETAMMGFKPRVFAPISALTLDTLVPADYFYRQLDGSLDLAFVRDVVVHCYATGGRPSVDPVVFFKTHPEQYPNWPHTPRRRLWPGR